ncbi:MAG: hypothetical protein JXA25_18405 [Anaerolineales bacterium]|nr:hypothetical protein [Anaerolineales bacterium]
MRITNSLLEDTLNLVSLAKEAAHSRGINQQAERLSPVVDELRSLVEARNNLEGSAPGEELLGPDFRQMLVKMGEADPAAPLAESPQAKNHVVAAMAEGGMSELDIARYMGVSREEVRLILNISRPATPLDRR